MPKNRKVVKHDGVSTVQNVPSKLMIGTRKSGTSASLMSNERLNNVLKDKNLKSDWDNALTVLKQRGVKVSA